MSAAARPRSGGAARRSVAACASRSSAAVPGARRCLVGRRRRERILGRAGRSVRDRPVPPSSPTTTTSCGSGRRGGARRCPVAGLGGSPGASEAPRRRVRSRTGPCRAHAPPAGRVPGTRVRACADRRIPWGSPSSTCRWSCRTSWRRPSPARTARCPPRRTRSTRAWPCSAGASCRRAAACQASRTGARLVGSPPAGTAGAPPWPGRSRARCQPPLRRTRRAPVRRARRPCGSPTSRGAGATAPPRPAVRSEPAPRRRDVSCRPRRPTAVAAPASVGVRARRAGPASCS